ncbi:hypothetical protein [Nocardioides lacusdianchii]|uniref:hypothetical protein n=1 Tax=Nocardioides lacusdianchii TaxID=2783664 RepID=UPI001CC9D6C9|nr:hypothetical protein [Nocardioides lacusdianchii]
MATSSTPEGQVRLLINDTATTDPVFTDDEITTFLALEDGNVKRAAAQALDTIADDEALTSKAIRTQDLATDGAKVADSLRKRAASLRSQADKADDDADDGFFAIVPMNVGHRGPELTRHEPGYWP